MEITIKSIKTPLTTYSGFTDKLILNCSFGAHSETYVAKYKLFDGDGIREDLGQTFYSETTEYYSGVNNNAEI